MRHINWGNRKRNKETTDSNFKTLIQKAIDSYGGTVHIYRYDPENQSGPTGSALPPFDSDAKDWKDRDIQSYLNQQHGGGRYRVHVDFKNKEGKETEFKVLDYTIAGEAKEGTYESKKAKQAETQQVTEIFKTAMDFAKEVKGDGSTGLVTALINANSELQKQNSLNMLEMQKHSDNMMMEMQKRNDTLMLELRRDSEAGGNITELIGNMMQMEKLKSTLRPEFKEPNETLELVRAVGPVLAQVLASKMGIPPQEQIKMIKTPTPGETESLGAPSLHVPPPPPVYGGLGDGGIEAQQKTTPSEPGKQVPPFLVPPSDGRIEIKNPNGTSIKRDEFEIVMLDPIIDQINAGASPEKVAQLIQMVISWSFLRAESGIEPHPILIGIVGAVMQASEGKADFAAIEKAYTEFARMIEMPVEYIEPIKQELYKAYMPLFAKAQAQSPVGDGKAGVVDVASTTE